MFFHRNPHRPAQNLTQKKQEQKQKYMNTNYENKIDNNYEKKQRYRETFVAQINNFIPLLHETTEYNFVLASWKKPVWPPATKNVLI